jgi:hypothetical protein
MGRNGTSKRSERLDGVCDNVVLPARVVDSFFTKFANVEDVARKLTYRTEVYPADNTEYPGIAKNLPSGLVQSIVAKLRHLGFSEVEPVLSFFRLSVPGPRAPHYVHTDYMTGQYTLLAYLSEQEGAGTGFYQHKETGMYMHPTTQEGIEVWARDQRDLSLWDQTHFVQMKRNRALVFDSRAMHCALPTEGFGSDVKDGRLVLTMFFNGKLSDGYR